MEGRTLSHHWQSNCTRSSDTKSREERPSRSGVPGTLRGSGFQAEVPYATSKALGAKKRDGTTIPRSPRGPLHIRATGRAAAWGW